MSHISHYPWLEKNMPIVCKNYGIPYQNNATAYGDKCSETIREAEKAGIPFYHACAMYFLTYEKGVIQDSTRQKNGINATVNIAKWIAENHKNFLYLFENCGGEEDCVADWL